MFPSLIHLHLGVGDCHLKHKHKEMLAAAVEDALPGVREVQFDCKLSGLFLGLIQVFTSYPTFLLQVYAVMAFAPA